MVRKKDISHAKIPTYGNKSEPFAVYIVEHMEEVMKR